MKKTSYVIMVVFVMSFFMTTTCFAHKITLFAYIDQGLVKTEAKFSGGREAKHCQISMITEAEPVFVGETDDNGMLDFPIPQEKDGFHLVVTCGDGHRGTWRIEADELRGGAMIEDHTHPQPVGAIVTPDSANIRSIIREELKAELGPIKRQLAQLKGDSVSLADIMGGLGYFLGLAGLASYMRFRKERK